MMRASGGTLSGRRSRQRLAWLLRSNRVLGPSEFRSARRFAEAFRLDGQPALAPSQVTRWETGQIAADATVVRRYENLLGLPDDSLTIVGEAYATFLDGPVPSGEQDRRFDDGLLHELLARASTAGAMGGRDWRKLTLLISSRPALVLHPPDLWLSITDTLLNELVSAEHRSWYIRQTAMARLLAHPASAPHAVEACIDMANDKNNPVFIEPISLLDAAQHDRANQYVLNEALEPRNEPSLHGTLLAAASKLRRGHYGLDQRVALSHAALDLRHGYERHPVIRPLVDDLFGTLSPGRTRRRPELADRIAIETRTRLADDTGKPDAVLAELIGEALFNDNSDARLYTAALLGATPYRTPLAATVAHVLGRTVSAHSDLLVERILRLLTRLRTTDHQRWIGQLLTDDAASAHARHAAVWAASHSASRRDELDWHTIVRHQMGLFTRRPSPLDNDILRGLAYSIGAEAHGRLITLLSTHPMFPADVRNVAMWWRSRTPVTI